MTIPWQVSLSILAVLSFLAPNIVHVQYGAAEAGDTIRVNVSVDGGPPSSEAIMPDISADGRYVAFVSPASNLVPEDTDQEAVGGYHVFVRDLQTSTTRQISVTSDGQDGNGDSWAPSISGDGRFIAFRSAATNLVLDDTNERHDAFVFDQQTGAIERIESRGNPVISDDGRFVAIHGYRNDYQGAYLFDRASDTVERVDLSNDGTLPSGELFSSVPRALSSDGRYVAFTSDASELMTGSPDSPLFEHVFVRDRQDGVTEHVSVSSDGIQYRPHGDVDISSDGQLVVFAARTIPRLPGQSTSYPNIYMRNRDRETTIRVSIAIGNGVSDSWCLTPTISDDGRSVAFASSASNLVSDDDNGRVDVFVRDLLFGVTTRVSVASDGTESNGDSSAPALDANGQSVTFESQATNLVTNDADPAPDVYVHEVHSSPTRHESAQQHFERTWTRTDRPVREGLVSRSWIWGPVALTTTLSEKYLESPGGMREVQYFDKARMEVTNPDTGDPNSAWYVTNGLLVVEMMTGKLQLGDATFEQRAVAEVPVAGDPDDPDGPTYATFAALTEGAANRSGSILIERVDRSGLVTSDPVLLHEAMRVGYYDPITEHNVALPFWEFMNASGLVFEIGAFVEGRLFQDPVYATGRPLTEPYWADVRVAGVSKLVLMQCFERRCLTYTPDNPAEWQVEAGNVGRHYYQWRYGKSPEQPQGTIAFLRITVDEDGDVESTALTVQADGTRERSLGPALDPPQLSPDGTLVLWAAMVDNDAEIVVARSDGSDAHTLTDNSIPDRGPVWSPDGSLIAFERDGVIWVMHADGTDQHPVTKAGDSPKSHPVWSPDGTKIAFWNTFDPIGRYSGISVVSADGTGETSIVGCAGTFTWMPNSLEIIAGPGYYIGCPYTYFIVGVDGSHLGPLEIVLPDGTSFSGPVTFSPDGMLAAFRAREEEAASPAIYVAKSDFSDAYRVAEDRAGDLAWSPDSRWIAFSHYNGLYIASISDSRPVQPVTWSPGMKDRNPMWR